MREIKFRAWDTKENKWFEPVYEAYKGQLEELTININGAIALRDMVATWGTHPKCKSGQPLNERYILCQYTGLKDKNGVEIYEGDILRQEFGRHYWIYEVKPAGGQFGNMLFAMTRKDNCTVNEEGFNTFCERIVTEGCRNYIPHGKDCEVIGNIYENPELIN